MKEILFSADQIPLIAEVKKKFQELQIVRDRFLTSLKSDDHLPAWGPGEGETDPVAARAAAASLYGDFFFPDQLGRGGTEDDLTNELSKGYGVVGASKETVELAVEFNREKKKFDEKTLNPLRKETVAIDLGPGHEKISMQLDRAVLKACGLATLSEKQVSRKIWILDKVPERIIFTWATTSSTTYITVRETRERLRDMSVTPKIAAGLRELDRLPNDEPLALVRSLLPHMRVNFGYYDELDQQTHKKRMKDAQRKYAIKESLIKYKQFATSMPVLVMMDEKLHLPKITPPKMIVNTDAVGQDSGNKQKARKRRKHSKLADKALIDLSDNLRIYRYEQSKRDKVYNSAKWQEILAREDLTA